MENKMLTGKIYQLALVEIGQFDFELKKHQRHGLRVHLWDICHVYRNVFGSQRECRENAGEWLFVPEILPSHDKTNHARLNVQVVELITTHYPAAGIVRRIPIRILETGRRYKRNPMFTDRRPVVLNPCAPIFLVEIVIG